MTYERQLGQGELFSDPAFPGITAVKMNSTRAKENFATSGRGEIHFNEVHHEAGSPTLTVPQERRINQNDVTVTLLGQKCIFFKKAVTSGDQIVA